MNEEIKAQEEWEQWFLSFIKTLFLKPRVFFSNEYIEKKLYMNFCIILFAVYWWIDRLDRMVLKSMSNPEEVESKLVESWVNYWGFLLFASLFSWAMYYFLGAWFYRLRVKWSWWEASVDYSRGAYVYSFFFLAIASILMSLSDFFLYATPFDAYLAGAIWNIYIEMTLLIFWFLAMIHSTYLKYVSAMTRWENVSKWKAIFWFMVLPVLIFIVLSFWIVIAILMLA